jgi:ANTAR domain
MKTDWVPAQLCRDMEGRRISETALGILIGHRRCSSDAAFQELLGAAQRHGFPAFPMALGTRPSRRWRRSIRSNIWRRAIGRTSGMGSALRDIRRADRLSVVETVGEDLKYVGAQGI